MIHGDTNLRSCAAYLQNVSIGLTIVFNHVQEPDRHHLNEPSICRSIRLSIDLSFFYLSTDLTNYLRMYLSIYLPIHLAICWLASYLAIYLLAY